VITESGYNILEVSRTGRMAMRRGKHTSRVMKALGGTNGASSAEIARPTSDEIIPNVFEDVHEEEE
jgi:acetolactate synthase-1/3 small subunit